MLSFVVRSHCVSVVSFGPVAVISGTFGRPDTLPHFTVACVSGLMTLFWLCGDFV